MAPRRFEPTLRRRNVYTVQNSTVRSGSTEIYARTGVTSARRYALGCTLSMHTFKPEEFLTLFGGPNTYKGRRP